MALTKSLKDIIAEDKTGLLSKHPSWERVNLREVANVLNGFPFESKRFHHTYGFPLIRIRDILTGDTETYFNGEYLEEFVVYKGELLVGMDGDFNSAFWDSQNGLLNQRVCKITPEERFYSKKLLGYVLPGFLKAINDATSSITVKHLSSRSIEEIELPLPPFNEQIQIVEKLEELLSDLDAGVAELKAAQKKLTQYRQSLLKAAVQGTLTAEWRAERAKHGEPLETGAQLLERILAERRRRWDEKQLAKFKEQGKTSPKDWRDKYPEPVKPNTAGLPELPDGWVWATIDQLAIEMKYGSSAKTSVEIGGIPVLRMGNIQDGELDIQDLKFLPADHDEFPSLILRDGDLLFNRTNSPDLVGKTAIYRSQIAPCSYASYLIAVQFSPSFISEFASAYINSIYGRLWIKSVVTQQVGQANVNGSKLAALAIPLPPYQEKIEIVRRLFEQRRSSFEQSKAIEYGLKQSSAQRQNILKAAFSGQLVPQDPNDEPASVLLERIRAERAARESGGKRRGRKVRKDAA